MKRIALSLACALIAGVSMAAAARPASAGLDFTDTATFAAGTPDVTFNGSAVTGTSVTMVNGFGGGDIANLVSTGTFAGSSATVDFAYTGLTTGGFFGFTYSNYDRDVGNPAYTMVVQFGTITGSGSLTTISFTEVGGANSNTFNLNQALSSADSGRKLFIQIPVGNIPLSQRDLVQTVHLGFAFASATNTQISIQAVVNPEPGTVALFGLGLIGLAGAVRSRRRARLADVARAQNA